MFSKDNIVTVLQLDKKEPSDIASKSINTVMYDAKKFSEVKEIIAKHEKEMI